MNVDIIVLFICLRVILIAKFGINLNKSEHSNNQGTLFFEISHDCFGSNNAQVKQP